jgi:isopentenyl diphosphate isomerase/L-lactate dehydrogenase-like FMN-dependent dehydrogenase
VFLSRLAKSPEEDPRAAALEWIKVWGNSLRWQDLDWLRSLTSLPILLKGIQHPDDVRRARDHGMDGIYCSNHGGRQANGGLAALDALPAVVEAADEMPVLFDSGVRSGSDVAKALALGATAVGIGRPYAYALAVGGTDGVVAQLRAILARTRPADGHRRVPHHRRPACSRRSTHLTAARLRIASGGRAPQLLREGPRHRRHDAAARLRRRK